jgi:predicted TIM-barrel fold metal-dependent hydrolase
MTEVAYIEVGISSEAHRRQLKAAASAGGQLETMAEDGIDVAVLLPTYAPFLAYDDEIDADRSRAYTQAYNRWLSDECRLAPDRLKGAALISRHEPEHMVKDLEACLGLGLRAVVLRPNPVRGRTLGSPELESFYAACAAQGIPVLLHEGAHTRVETAGATRFRTHFAQHACSHPMEAMMGVLALLEGGVLERHPTLRVGLLESGCGWLPYWLWRLDKEHAQLRNEVRNCIKQRPSEYFRRQCWIAFEPDEALLLPSIEAIGLDRVVFGTDFPHPDHDTNIVDELFERSALDPAVLRAASWDNPARLLGLDPTAHVGKLLHPGRVREVVETGPGAGRQSAD